jgi:hypothetical protein
VESTDDQPLAPGGVHRLTEGLILEGVHGAPVDRLDALQLGENRRAGGAVEAEVDANGRQSISTRAQSSLVQTPRSLFIVIS